MANLLKSLILIFQGLLKKPVEAPKTGPAIAPDPKPPAELKPPDPIIITPEPAVIIKPQTISPDDHLSAHFTFGMLTKTEHREFLEKNRSEAQQYIENLTRLCNEILEPVYTLMGSCLITSAFRCPDLNKTIGGSVSSQHTIAEAADTEYVGATEGPALKEAFNKIAFSNIKYGQCILEFMQWIHISLIDEKKHPGKISQKLVASSKDGKTVYTAVTKPL